MKHLIFCFVALTCVSEAFVVVPPGRRAAAVALQRATKADSQERMDELVKKWSDLVKEKEAGKNPDKTVKYYVAKDMLEFAREALQNAEEQPEENEAKNILALLQQKEMEVKATLDEMKGTPE